MSGNNQLVVATAENIQTEMKPISVEDVPVTKETADPVLVGKAKGFVDMLFDESINANEKRDAIDEMSSEDQKRANPNSELLKESIKNLADAEGKDGGKVAQALLELKNQVEELDPVNFDFSVTAWSKLISKIPFVGNKMKAYFDKYSSGQTIISAIIKSLKFGRDELIRDNKILAVDQEKMRKSSIGLKKAIELGILMDEEMSERLINMSPEDQKYKFVQEELLFPMKQRIIDLQQTLAVNQQGVIVYEILIRNNRELIRGVNRALNVTIHALNVAVTAAFVLNHQRIVLDKIDGVNKITSALIVHTSERLKTQGVEIQKQSSSTMIEMESLKAAFRNINEAVEDITTFRRNALSGMSQNIQELNKLALDAEETITKLEKGDSARSKIHISVEEMGEKV
ncbi:MAG: toxic anion resistance protein [Nanoarchaeota archaeon]|nr:toxic anion resistance protein [Nanoarchaeota archaeon]